MQQSPTGCGALRRPWPFRPASTASAGTHPVSTVIGLGRRPADRQFVMLCAGRVLERAFSRLLCNVRNRLQHAAGEDEEEASMTRRAYGGWRYPRTPFYIRAWRYSPIMSVGIALAILVLVMKLVLGVVRRFTE